MIKKELVNLADETHDLESFQIFIEALQDDFIKNNDEWENIKIDTYLQAIASWLDDHTDSKRLGGSSDTWELLASALYAGKIYE